MKKLIAILALFAFISFEIEKAQAQVSWPAGAATATSITTSGALSVAAGSSNTMCNKLMILNLGTVAYTTATYSLTVVPCTNLKAGSQLILTWMNNSSAVSIVPNTAYFNSAALPGALSPTGYVSQASGTAILYTSYFYYDGTKFNLVSTNKNQ